MRGLPTIGHFRFHGLFSALPDEALSGSTAIGGIPSAHLASAQVAQVLDLDRLNLTPEEDISLTFRPEETASAVHVLKAGDFVLTAFRSPRAAPPATRTPRPWIFFVDTSASLADAAGQRVSALRALLSALPAEDSVEIFVFDQEIERLGKKSAADWAGSIATALEKRRSEAARAKELGADLSRTDALRITLAWETDANDVDLHVVDPRGEECFYQHKATRTGLELYEDITQGFGPEVIRTETLAPGTYSVGVNYYSAGPMGVSRGVLVIMRPGASSGSFQLVPFRLVDGDRDVRLLAQIDTGPESKALARISILRK